MKRKIVVALSLILVMVMGVTGLAACGKKHNYDKKWSADKNYHWHACIDKDCKSEKDKAKHTFGKWVTTKKPTATEKGEKTRSCTVCKEKQTQEIPATGKKKLSLASRLRGELDVVTKAAHTDCDEGACDYSGTDDKHFEENDCGMLFIEDDENFFGDNFGKMCDEAEQTHDRIQALKKEYDGIMDARAELWDKVFASYDELGEDFDYANFDEAKYIAGLAVLTAEEKEALLEDLAKLDEISQKLYGICGANCGRW